MGGSKLRFRVNVTPITTAKSPKNYGSAGGLVDHGAGEKCLRTGMRNAHCTQDSGLGSLLTGDRFETIRSYHKKQDPPLARASKRGNPHADRPGRPSHAHRRSAAQG